MAAGAAPQGWQWGEPRALGRAVKLLQRLEEQCRDLRLVVGPPSLRDLLPRTAQLLREVAKARCDKTRGDPEGPGGASDFLVIYLANLEAKGRQVAELLPPRGKKDANQDVFPEGSRFRRQLAKLSLIFSHMHAELSALFPEGKYCGHLYQLTKGSAHVFWRENCGVRCVLPWAEFQSLLCSCHPVEPGPTMQALRSTLDLTCSGHISVFEFDIFTRLFQPWPTLLRNWQLLAVNHPGYMAFLTYDEVQTRLQAYRDKPGSYIFRPSCTRLGQWAIGYVSSDGSILQTIPLNKPLLQVLLKGQKDGIFLFPDGKNHNPDLTELCRAQTTQCIQVSEEQLQLYQAMNSTFELCKICAERDKDVRIEPCGHLLCSCCLAAWQHSNSQTCPFCRCEIKGREAVSICQAQERTVEVRTATGGSGDNCHQETAEWKLEPVTPSAPPLPPEDPCPQRPQDKGWLTLQGERARRKGGRSTRGGKLKTDLDPWPKANGNLKRHSAGSLRTRRGHSQDGSRPVTSSHKGTAHPAQTPTSTSSPQNGVGSVGSHLQAPGQGWGHRKLLKRESTLQVALQDPSSVQNPEARAPGLEEGSLGAGRGDKAEIN